MKTTVRSRMIGNIPVLEVVPEEKKNEVLPLIVYYHGWQTNKEMIFSQGKKIAEAGFRLVLPDAANHGKRKQMMSEIPSLIFFDSIHTNLFEFGYIVDYFKQRGLCDERIGVGGLSMGGMTTCALLTQNPEIKAAACLMGTPKLTAYRDRIRHYATKFGRYLPNDYEMLTNWIPEYDLSRQPEKLNGRPLFIWHGSEDDRVAYADAVEFIENNLDADLTVELEEGAGHLVVPQTVEKVRDFFMRELQ
ncbi:alpha/beta fold hydrolase [Atopococcus tabaci]|uniref:alpha/beta fold hydrolase n=1 Tax=Atopococcus tabaci TaxID=269774 RepID=UPI000416FC3A|nr:alpha/beta fold hydrolase [Atopococcus tabaci]